MSSKTMIWVSVFVGSTLGAYLPNLWGAGFLSPWSVIGSVVGGLLGVYVGYKLL